MKIFNKNIKAIVSGVSFMLVMLTLTWSIVVLAATTPSLGTATTYAILSNTFTRNVAITAITGDLGYTTLGGSGTNTVSGTTHVADAAYSQAGTDQGTALSTGLAPQPCTFTFPDTNIDLATDVTHGTIGIYTSGVYCTQSTRSASIGSGGITLSGGGTFIFRINGALTTAANSIVTLSGASACDVFWTPTSATTLGANSTFIGTDIDNSGITVGDTVAWTGRALAFGGTVTTQTDNISVPTSCTPTAATLHIVKQVINGGVGTAFPSNFNLHVKLAGTDVATSPQAGTSAGTAYSLAAGTYVVSEDANALYTSSFSGDCNSSGSITLLAGQDRTCTLTNTAVGIPPGVNTQGSFAPLPLINLTKIPTPLALPGGAGPVTYNYTVTNVGVVPAYGVWVKDDKCSPVNFVSGDTNNNSVLDLNEVWTYSCNGIVSSTVTNTATAHGAANGWDGYDTASATVVVGQSILPPLIHLVKIPNKFVLPVGGGQVIYTYTVTNPGVIALSDVTITDNKCTGLPGRIVGHPGDVNNNNLLDPGEVWNFTCVSDLTQTTTNIGTVEGSANGFTATDFSSATVLVSAPGLPLSGLPPKATLWDVVVSICVLILISTSFIILNKHRN